MLDPKVVERERQNHLLLTFEKQMGNNKMFAMELKEGEGDEKGSDLTKEIVCIDFKEIVEFCNNHILLGMCGGMKFGDMPYVVDKAALHE